MIKLIEKEPIYLELYQALSHFVGRQQLVVRFVVEQGISLAELSRGVGGWYDKSPQVGHWGEDWEFFFHGGGCELRHRITGEPIDWNGPDPLAFGHLPFVHHLKWRLTHESGLPHLHKFVDHRDPISVIDLIQHLTDSGIITPERHVSPDVEPARKSAA
jgi:hypothetical protein